MHIFRDKKWNQNRSEIKIREESLQTNADKGEILVSIVKKKNQQRARLEQHFLKRVMRDCFTSSHFCFYHPAFVFSSNYFAYVSLIIPRTL